MDSPNLQEIIPISFKIYEVNNEKYYIETTGKITARGVKPLKVHNFDKNPNLNAVNLK